MNHEITETADFAKGQFLIYQAEDGELSPEATVKKFLTVYEDEELAPEATHKKYLSVRQEGRREVKRLLDYYNLDMIISVG